MGGVFSIAVRARFDAFNHWSRIIDFGNGAYNENVVLANMGGTNTLRFDVYKGWCAETIELPNFFTQGKWRDGPFEGAIDDLRIYKHALSGEEVRSLFVD